MSRMRDAHCMGRRVVAALAGSVFALGASAITPGTPDAIEGSVRMKQSLGMPMAGVTIQTDDGRSASTNAQGRFVIPPNKRRARSPRRLSVRLEGHGVVNDALLHRDATADSSGGSVNLVLAPLTDLQLWREHHLNEQLVLLARQHSSTRPSAGHINGAAIKWDFSGGAVVDAHQFASTWALLAEKGSADSMPPLLLRGLHAWWTSNPTAAMAVLSMDKLQQQGHQVPLKACQATQAWMLRTALAAALGDSDGAQEVARQTTQTHPDCAEGWHLLGALLLTRQGSAAQDEAHAALTRALRLHAQAPNAPTQFDKRHAMSVAHDELGRLLERTARHGKALAHWQQAMGLSSSLQADAQGAEQLRHFDGKSRAGLNVARMHSALGDHQRAGHTLLQVVAWRRELAKLDPSLSRQTNLATSLLNLSQALHAREDPCAAIAAWQEARDILLDLSDLDPFKFQGRLHKARSDARVLKGCPTSEGQMTGSFRGGSLFSEMPSHAMLEALPRSEWASSIERWQAASHVAVTATDKRGAEQAAQWSLRVLDLQLRESEEAPSPARELAIARTLTRIGSLQQMTGQHALAVRNYAQAALRWERLRGSPAAPPWLPSMVNTLHLRVAELTEELPR